MRERTEAGRLRAVSPHVENGAALHSRAGTHRALIGGSGEHGHARQTMSQTIADGDYRTYYSGKNLSRPANLDSRFYDIANPDHAHRLAWRHDIERRRFDAR